MKDIQLETTPFHFNNSEEVQIFSDNLEIYIKNAVGHLLINKIDIIKVFYTLRNEPNKKLFTAFFDLNLTYVMLFLDFNHAMASYNVYNSKVRLDGGNLFTDQTIFNERFEFHHNLSTYIFRYRAIWDKIMGIIIIRYKPDQYDHFYKARSKKAEFAKIISKLSPISSDQIKKFTSSIKKFDDDYRTAEVHGAGRLRKWSFQAFPHPVDPLVDFAIYQNWLISTFVYLDKIFTTEKEFSNTPIEKLLTDFDNIIAFRFVRQ